MKRNGSYFGLKMTEIITGWGFQYTQDASIRFAAAMGDKLQREAT
jgi:hypothetical protein